MEDSRELNQLVYSLLKTQIEFGTYGFKYHLPTIEGMAELLVVSIDTIRLAYRQLQKEGYIRLIKSVGSVVAVQYSEQEIERHIQSFFSPRKDMCLDICRSMPFLLGGIQAVVWRKVPMGDLQKLKDAIYQKQTPLSYLVILYMQMVYRSLKNDLLISLIRRLIITYLVPFLSLKEYLNSIHMEVGSIPSKIDLLFQKDYDALHDVTIEGLKENYLDIKNFYDTRIVVSPTEGQAVFMWSSYKKASQVCYSVGLEILTDIFSGLHPAGSFLPSLKSLAEDKQVSVSTIRHTLILLNDLGIVKTLNGIGTQILSVDQVPENCNLSSATVQRRLLDCQQSLQLFALTCREVAALTITSIDEQSKNQWLEQLLLYERLETYDLSSTFSLSFISRAAPYPTIRAVYAELRQQLLWGIPLRGQMGTQETINAFYLPHHRVLVDALKNNDAQRFAAKMEEILIHEAGHVTRLLADLGIHKASFESAPIDREASRR